MDRWATLVPDRPKRFSGSSSYAPTSLTADAPVPSSLSSNAERDHVGELPVSVVLRVLEHVAVPELASCALAARPLARLVADERLWKAKLDALDWHEVEGLVVSGAPSKPLHDGQQRALHAESSVTAGKGTGAGADDDFGDFEESGPGVHVADESFGDFTTAETPGASGPGRPTGSAGGNLLEFCDEQDRVGELRDFSRISLNKGNSRASVPPGGIVAGKDTRGNARPTSVPLFSYRAEAALPSAPASAKLFRTYSTALAPFISSLRTSAAPTSSLIFSKLPNLSAQATLLGNLARFVSPRVKGVRDWPEVGGKTREAADYLEGVLISAFEGADARRAEAGPGEQPKIARAESDMRAHAYMLHDLASAWTDATNVAPGEAPGGAACAQVFLERRAIFYGGLGHDPLKNVISSAGALELDFTAMDRFMSDVLGTIKEEGSLIARVFPPQQDVLLAFAERVANEVIAEYVSPLLIHARSLSTHLYLRSCAATFAQALRVVDTLLAIQPRSAFVTRERAEDVVYRMWEANMDEYLQEERDWVREEMEKVCEAWNQDLAHKSAAPRMDAAFLASQNPAAVKRSVLTNFKDVLLLPVTVVPRTAGYIGSAVARTAGTGLAQLNPRSWQAGSATARVESPTPEKDGVRTPGSTDRRGEINEKDRGYIDFSNGAPGKRIGLGLDGAAFDAEDEDDMHEHNEWSTDVSSSTRSASTVDGSNGGRPTSMSTRPSTVSGRDTPVSGQTSGRNTPQPRTTSSQRLPGTANASPSGGPSQFARLQLLLSLDTALQLVHVDRDCLKRIETFSKYPGNYGHRVRDEIEEVAVAFLQCLGERHVAPGFARATTQIKTWRPAEHEQDAESTVAPLVHFFELVHVGDTIQQMVQVYFDQELSTHIDRTDFLNGVVREKKRFEGALDEAVAAGLNAGVDLLMGQAEHIISTRQDPRDFYPEKGEDMDLGNPTRACAECVECLRTHCKMLVGSTDKNVLEVFYQEVGIRLHAIICKHLKRQIVSLEGGFKVIADLNAYHAFVASLRQPAVTAYFDALKMLGNVFIIENAKDLGQIVRDANMYGGTLSPDEVYEFLQARCDFKAIEKAVDKEMYGFKVSEDCVVC